MQCEITRKDDSEVTDDAFEDVCDGMPDEDNALGDDGGNFKAGVGREEDSKKDDGQDSKLNAKMDGIFVLGKKMMCIAMASGTYLVDKLVGINIDFDASELSLVLAALTAFFLNQRIFYHSLTLATFAMKTSSLSCNCSMLDDNT